MKIINTITILLVYQLIGEIIVRYFSWSIPGPVFGMLLLFLSLLFWGGGKAYDELEDKVSAFLMHLSLLFVPAGVGVMSYTRLIGHEWKTIVTTLVCSALLTLIGSAVIMKSVSHLVGAQIAQQDRTND